METVQNIIEYYDELYPIAGGQKEFFTSLVSEYVSPAKLLRVFCGTGLFEHHLAREGLDVTGLETNPELLKCASLRRRNQLMSLRFFQMTTQDMSRFLGKGFYNVAYCLDDALIFLPYEEQQELFTTCKNLLAEDGAFVLELANYSQFGAAPNLYLKDRASVRAKLFSQIDILSDGTAVMQQSIETGNGHVLPVKEDVRVYPATCGQIEDMAHKAGFKSIRFLGSWSGEPLAKDSDRVVAVLR